MSYTYLQEQGEESSAESFSDIPQFVLSRLNLTAEKSYYKDSETESYQSFLSGTMCEHSTGSLGEDWSTSYAVVSPARILVQQVGAQESRASVLECGWKWHESSVKYDPATSLWKTRQCSLLEGLDEFSETWPKWGIMCDGESWELITPAHLTREIESGLWATPTRCDFKGLTCSSQFAQRAKQAKELTEGVAVNGTFYPNPTTYEVLMGWPLGWTDLKPLETDKFQAWLHSHGKL